MKNDRIDEGQIGRRSSFVLKIFMLCLTLIGIYALGMLIVQGHGITGMQDNVPWGVFIVNFIFLLGISYGCALLGSILFLYKAKWSYPYLKLLEIISVIMLLVGPIYILLCIGRPDRILNLIFNPRLQSPITWDFFMIALDFILCLIYIQLSSIEYFSERRDEIGTSRKGYYSFFSFNYRGTRNQKIHLEKAKRIVAIMIVVTSVLAYSILAWLFGTNLHPGWNSTLTAPSYLVSAVLSGISIWLIVMHFYSDRYVLANVDGKRLNQYVYFGLWGSWTLYLYFFISEFITIWYNQTISEVMWLQSLTDFGGYGKLYVLVIIMTIAIPLIVLLARIRKYEKSLISVWLAVSILVGIWIKYYLQIVVTLDSPFVPNQDIRESYQHYQPTWIEWSIVGLGVVVALVLFKWMYRWFDAIPPVLTKDSRKTN